MAVNFFKQADKIKHMGASAIISMLVIGANIYYGTQLDYLAFTVLITLVAVSVGKEIIYDKMMGRGTPDIMDVLANTIGMGVPLLTYSLALLLLGK